MAVKDNDGAAGAGKETLTGDEGKNPPAPKDGENIDTGGDKPGAKAGEKVVDGKEGDAGKKAGEGKDGKDGKEGKDGEAPGEKGGKGSEGKEGTAPEKYELKLPDDAGDYLDEGDLKAVETAARAKGWTNDQAQSALEEYATGLAAQSQAFRVETEKDATYGGDNLPETQRLARLALDRVRPANTEQGKELRRLLAKTGYGNNLKIVSLLADIGKLMAEDAPGGSGRGTGGDKKDAADLLYGGTPVGGG